MSLYIYVQSRNIYQPRMRIYDRFWSIVHRLLKPVIKQNKRIFIINIKKHLMKYEFTFVQDTLYF